MKLNVITAIAVVCTSYCSAQYTGKVGVNTPTPTETLHVNGTARVQDLPSNGTPNAIYNGATTKGTIFNATRTVVADANGVLGTVSGLPKAAENFVITNAASYNVPNQDGVYVGTVASTFTLPDASVARHGETIKICSNTSNGAINTVTIKPSSTNRLVVPQLGAIQSTTVSSNDGNNCREFRFDSVSKNWWVTGL